MANHQLLQGLVSEASDLLDDAEAALVSYPKITDDAGRNETVNRVFRHFHSIKGSAGFVELNEIAKVTHEAETLLEQYRNSSTLVMPHETTDLLCRTIDFLRILFDVELRMAANDETEKPADIISDMQGLIQEISNRVKSLKNRPSDLNVEIEENGRTQQHTTTIQISGRTSPSRVIGKAPNQVAPPEGKSASGLDAPPPHPRSDTTIIPRQGGGKAGSDTTKVNKADGAKSQSGRRSATSESDRRHSDTSMSYKSDTATIIRSQNLDSNLTTNKNEFLNRYINEANELLEQTEQALLLIEQHPEDTQESIQETFRALHSFKGNSGFMNLRDLEHLSHRMESEIESSINKSVGINIQTIDVLLQMIDVLRQGVLNLSCGGSGEIPEANLYITMMDEIGSSNSRDTGMVNTQVRDPVTAVSEKAPEPPPPPPPPPPEPPVTPVAQTAAEPPSKSATAVQKRIPQIVTRKNRSSPDTAAPGPATAAVPVAKSPPSRPVVAAAGAGAEEPPQPPAGNSLTTLEPRGKASTQVDLATTPRVTHIELNGPLPNATPATREIKAPTKMEVEAKLTPTRKKTTRIMPTPDAPVAVPPPPPAAAPTAIRPVAPPRAPIPKVNAPEQPAPPPVTTPRATPNSAGAGAGAGAAAGASPQKGVAAPRTDIRVDLNKLDLMLDLVGELVIAETMVTRHPALIDQENESLERAVHQLRRVANSLQDMAMSVRMIPLSSTFRRMIRLVYDLSIKAGKQVDLVLLGEETEVDRTVIERISDPLVHIIRNAIDHGLETSEDRLASGKPETGRVTIEGRHEGGEVWIVITDDGRGLSREKIVRKGIERGLINGDGSDLSDGQIYHLIFEPGFSTADKITDISGRGFGMDVVKKNIEKLSGKIDIRTREGEGTAVIMRIPLTLAIIEGMLVRAGATRYIIPLLSIRESLKPDISQIMFTPDGQAMVKLRQDLIPVVRLDEVFRRVTMTKKIEDGILMVVEGEDGGVVALFVDELLGQQETVIKGLTGWLKKSRGVSGCTVLGDGEVGLILDIGTIIKVASRNANV
ncbi:MAG: Hpt domain-containing protein [Planctomycetota bacterium]|jgi:two-component system chemotaxis sensor kinase CheA|nr:Hpt domain-containing protein [Planctomycetota bacterium]